MKDSRKKKKEEMASSDSTEVNEMKRFCCKKCKQKYKHSDLSCRESFLENKCHRCGSKGCVHYFKTHIDLHSTYVYCLPCWESEKVDEVVDKECVQCHITFTCMGIKREICSACYQLERFRKKKSALESTWKSGDIVFEYISEGSCVHTTLVGKASETDLQLGYTFIKVPNRTVCGNRITRVTLVYPFQGYMTLRETSTQTTSKYIVYLAPTRTLPDYQLSGFGTK